MKKVDTTYLLSLWLGHFFLCLILFFRFIEISFFFHFFVIIIITIILFITVIVFTVFLFL